MAICRRNSMRLRQNEVLIRRGRTGSADRLLMSTLEIAKDIQQNSLTIRIQELLGRPRKIA